MDGIHPPSSILPRYSLKTHFSPGVNTHKREYFEKFEHADDDDEELNHTLHSTIHYTRPTCNSTCH
jgi:hypothetical protein